MLFLAWVLGVAAEGDAGREMLEQKRKEMSVKEAELQRQRRDWAARCRSLERVPETDEIRRGLAELREKEIAIREEIEDIQNQYRTMYEEVIMTRPDPNWAKTGEKLAKIRAKLREARLRKGRS